MSVCTFFGHRDAPEGIREKLKYVLIELIENEGVDLFYVGNEGRFDSMVRSEVKKLKKVYSHIKYYTVIYSLPYTKFTKEELKTEELIFPEDVECGPKRFAIDRRNKWMTAQADYVVTYVWKNYGGAYKFKCLAEKKNKKVINLCEDS